MQQHKSCLETIYRDLDVGIESAEILQGARVLRMKISRGIEKFLISSVSCLQCGTPISLEDTNLEGLEHDR